jgi:hypothetical protein
MQGEFPNFAKRSSQRAAVPEEIPERKIHHMARLRIRNARLNQEGYSRGI